MERGTASSHSQATLLTRLPLSLVRSIFGFAVDNSNASTATNRQSLAQVCREWYEYAWGMECAEKLRSFSIDPARMARVLSSSHEMLALRNALTLRRAHLRELRIEACETTLAATEVLGTLFAAIPQLEVLCIHSTSPLTLPTVQVLCAAVRHCSNVRSLTLSPKLIAYDPTAQELLLTTLLDCLVRWKQSSGGLRNLVATIPFEAMENAALKATQFVEALARYCPNLATVTNPLSLHRRHMHSLGQWHIGLETWEAVCASCTQLTAFDWSIVPFTTAFFKVFGNYVKPQLTSLTLSAPDNWDWKAYHRQYPEVTATGYGAAARNVHAVLIACPALRRLCVVYPVHNDDSSVATRATSDLFGDAFCETLATCCPMLERFELEPASHATLVMFTDRAMRALARLSKLTDATLAVVNITGDGLLALFVGSVDRRTWRRQRNYSISVGDGSASAHAQQFYTVAVQFLTLLAEWEDPQDDKDDAKDIVPPFLPGASERVLLQLSNLDDGQALESSREYVVTLKELTTTVLERHPQLRLRVVLQNPSFDEDGEVVDFSTIEELALYTQSTVLPSDDSWTIESDRVLDSVFVVRGGDDDQSMDEDDEDDDGGGYFYDDPYDAYDSDSYNGDPADYYDDYYDNYDDDMDVDADYDPESLYPF